MSVILLILQLAGLATSPPSQQECGDECLAVLRAAAEWARAEATNQEAAPDKIFFDFGPPISWAIPEEAMERRRNKYSQVGAALGLQLVRRDRHQSWHACMQAPHSGGCQRALGTGYLTLRGPNFLSENEALVHASVLVLRETSTGWVTVDCQLLLQRSPEGTWSVVEERLCVVS